jgi:hypothetical protein
MKLLDFCSGVTLRDSPTFVGRSRLRAAKAEAFLFAFILAACTEGQISRGLSCKALGAGE